MKNGLAVTGDVRPWWTRGTLVQGDEPVREQRVKIRVIQVDLIGSVSDSIGVAYS
ncbi:hypothetical protein PQQ52_19205 [Paraburkholderia sediminicola]|uniref:hypothetical protein n=1 Tax=Paraburkholderia sediminicola TaxID=458836 RepID=UPI0038B84F61